MFLEHYLFDHFCAPCSGSFTYPHILRCVLKMFCIVPQSFFLFHISIIHHIFLEFNVLARPRLWPPSGPLILSFRREILGNIIFLYRRANRVKIPRVPYFDVFIDVVSSDFSLGRAMQSGCAFHSCLLSPSSRCVNAVSFARPQLDHVEVATTTSSLKPP